MAKFTWKSAPVPEGMEIRQVYGILFSKDGRMLLKVEDKNGRSVYSMAGGHPETFDADMAATLAREVDEEINSSVFAPVYVGYQEVDEENDAPLYAQVRMTALLSSVGESRPDPDNGETYKRLLAPPVRAKTLLGWGRIAEEQIDAAKRIAEREYGLKFENTKEEYV